ncbi:hypothetical protein BCU90_19860 [Vibrio lentus]|uniref:hypothetical protein n=1 Tax=Vibrio lentus TaxID=136468 RepID=UPI000C860136|nr:hypothetical protein [Vibrio lentus]PMG44787.1 hypothetical protein BCU90_19860 [Vibrio lentus]PMH95866.1 hypothetical protein BCU54_11255 [Vibrio lentus]
MQKNFDIGKVVEIKLENGLYCYALVIGEPVVAFSELFFEEPQSDFDTMFDDSTFCIFAMKRALGPKGWVKVGKINNHPLFSKKHQFFKFDLISKTFSIYSECEETPATREQCLGLECAAVWDKKHIEDRLLAKSQGKECAWTTSMSAATQV